MKTPSQQRERAVSVSLLHKQPQNFKFLTARLRRLRQSKANLETLFVLVFACFLPGLAQLFFWLCHEPGRYYHPVLWFVISSLLCVWVFRAMKTTHSQYRQTVDALRNHSDVRATGPLLEQLKRHEQRNYPVIAEMLIGLLPRMMSTDAGLLNKAQRKCLYETLNIPHEFSNSTVRLYDCDEALALAALKALEQIGDAEAVPYVRRAATTHRFTAVLLAARECLPFLEQRIEQQRQSETLLRASDKRIDQSGILLRPAAPSNETAREQLLCPAVPADA